MNKLICGDALEELKKMPSESIDCCITSPPYWGLRDYGTAKWEGGDKNCSHKRDSKVSAKGETGSDNVSGGIGDAIYKDKCFRCGAIRQDNQLGLEKTPEEYVTKMVEVFREVKRVLKKEGTCWLNLGDTYSAARWSSGEGQPMNKMRDTHRAGEYTELRESNLPSKNLVGIPWRVAFTLQSDGWYLRQDIIWAKPNPMPESVTDRCTKAHEYIFLLAKNQKYYFDAEAIKEPANYDGRKDTKMKGSNKFRNSARYLNHASYNNSNPETFHSKGHERWQRGKEGEYLRNKRSVWTITTKPFKGAHFATFPEDLVKPCIMAGCPKSGITLDPFAGAGTVGVVAKKLGRNFIGIELNPKYVEMAQKRIENTQETFF